MEETQTIVKEKTAIQKLLELQVAEESVEEQVFAEEVRRCPGRFTRAFYDKGAQVFISTPSGKANPFLKIREGRKVQYEYSWVPMPDLSEHLPADIGPPEGNTESLPNTVRLHAFQDALVRRIFSATCMPSRIMIRGEQ